jgi:hypothetical protein
MLEDVVQHSTGPLGLGDRILTHQPLISGGVELIAGGGQEMLESLAFTR